MFINCFSAMKTGKRVKLPCAEYGYIFKIVLVGDRKVGTTSLARAFNVCHVLYVRGEYLRIKGRKV